MKRVWWDRQGIKGKEKDEGRKEGGKYEKMERRKGIRQKEIKEKKKKGQLMVRKETGKRKVRNVWLTETRSRRTMAASLLTPEIHLINKNRIINKTVLCGFLRG
jgi:hypothetical protein